MTRAISTDDTIILATMARIDRQTTSTARDLVTQAQKSIVRCYSCNEVKLATEFDASTMLCASCFDGAGMENEHGDGQHLNLLVKGCPTCVAA